MANKQTRQSPISADEAFGPAKALIAEARKARTGDFLPAEFTTDRLEDGLTCLIAYGLQMACDLEVGDEAPPVLVLARGIAAAVACLQDHRRALQ